MPGRLPTTSDFPPTLNLTITPPPPSHQPVNILVLLHGLGDSKDSFTRLAQQLALPETTCISLQAPTPLPFDLGGFHWGDDIAFDQASGQMDFDAGFARTTTMIRKELIEDALVQKCGYQPREILLFGLGQGGMAALAVAASFAPPEELGGIISIGGALPAEILTSGTKRRTFILILGGSSQTLVTQRALTRLREGFQFVEYTKWSKAGDGMAKSREEMMPIMQFFSRRLRSRQGVPEGSVEIT